MDEASRQALAWALDLAAKQQPPWGPDAILTTAEKFETFLTEPTLAEPLAERVTALEEIVHQLETELHTLGEPPPARPRKTGSTTGTTPREPLAAASDIPTPVDF